MNALRDGLPPLPPKMRELPVDERGYPVPYFVAWVDGKPDHRIADGEKMRMCIEQNRCWLCGRKLGSFKAFCIGPMCAITRTISEPPSHLECATYAATACPFLTRPHAKRREAGMPEEARDAAGNMIKRNPGAVCVWVTKRHRPFPVGGGILFDLGPPESTRWYAEGRLATRAEVDESIASGLPILVAEAQKDGGAQMAELNRRVVMTTALLDAVLPR